MSIPRIIHYCNFGKGTDSDTVNRMLNSIKEYCPDYEVILWNEQNFDISYNQFTEEAAHMNKWAFVSDVCRLYALKTYGGIYLDTDVVLCKSFDALLDNNAFFGFESKDRICTAVIGACPENSFINEILCFYEALEFNTTPNVTYITEKLISKGLKPDNTSQIIDGITILPQEYLSPKNFETSSIEITDNTYTVHYFESSWKSSEEKMRDKLFFRYKKLLPERLSWNLASYFAVMRFRGVVQGHKDMFKLLRKKD